MAALAELTGTELENYGQQVFSRMGLTCVHHLNQVSLLALEPDGPHSRNEHLEIDYLIPYRNVCLIGEITGRNAPSDVKRKYDKFRRHYELVTNQRPNEPLWRQLGVPSDRLRDFRGVTEFRGFFIVTRLQQFDVGLSPVPPIACFYSADARLLDEYSQCIGRYASYPFLQLFDVAPGVSRRPLELREDQHALMCTPNKKIGSNVGTADIYTFEANPYEILPVARVYRRDMLPDLASESKEKYQRPLIPKKLDDIRKSLLTDQPDFMFPNSILVVLSGDSRYSSDERILRIPDVYSAMSVIDGQHRLFSYADENVQGQLGNDARIMVTAIQFHDTNDEETRRHSARLFIEINTNQTRIRSTHLDAIAYEILGEVHPKAIAAHIILQANARPGPLYGLFDTNQTGLGKIQTTTVLRALKTIVRLQHIQQLCDAQRGKRFKRRCGYENLFGAPVQELCEAESLISHGIACFEQYFSRVASVFSHDWPERELSKGTSLEFAKMIAAFVTLLQRFISEGLNWSGVQAELEKIRNNVMQLRRMRNYNKILFDQSRRGIPDAQPSASEDFHFLNRNRQRATSIRSVRSRRRRR